MSKLLLAIKKQVGKIGRKKELRRVASELRKYVSEKQRIVIIVSYNNAVYVRNMVNQLRDLSLNPIVIDNNSNDFDCIKLLKELGCPVVWSKINFGERVGFQEFIYDVLPDHFGYTDPDIEFNPKIKEDFFDEFIRLSNKYDVYKVGFALRMPVNSNLKFTHPFKKNPFMESKEFSVNEWENRFWKRQIVDKDYLIYAAPIDTTFAIYNKQNYRYDFFDSIRIGGDFLANHLPWFSEIDIMNDKEKAVYSQSNIYGTWK